jgi:hypothetical protein
MSLIGARENFNSSLDGCVANGRMVKEAEKLRGLSLPKIPCRSCRPGEISPCPVAYCSCSNREGVQRRRTISFCYCQNAATHSLVSFLT